jgi:hypothetical protein
MANEAVIKYFSQQTRVVCDRQCGKAWGINNRPRVQLSDDENDYAFLADGELGEAPADPGTYEGWEGKPSSPDEFPNKWCVRECERSDMTASGDDWRDAVAVLSFDERMYNMPWLHPEL